MNKSSMPGMIKYGSVKQALSAVAEQSKKHHEVTLARIKSGFDSLKEAADAGKRKT